MSEGLKDLNQVGEQTWITESPQETWEIGRALGTTLFPPLVLLLQGDLGAGKTVLARGLLNGLGVSDEQIGGSPTFVLVHSYSGRCRIHHVDLYRLETLEEIYSVGLFELMEGPTITLVEWGEKLRPWILAGIEIQIEDLGYNRRCIRQRKLEFDPARNNRGEGPRAG